MGFLSQLICNFSFKEQKKMKKKVRDEPLMQVIDVYIRQVLLL